MSPDPPREESGDDGNQIRLGVEFIEGVIMDEQGFFIVPDAPYELDMEVESDYTDSSDDEDHTARNTLAQNDGVSSNPSDEQEFSFQGQGRGRYRLLIPFPSDNSPSNSSNESGEVTTRISVNRNLDEGEQNLNNTIINTNQTLPQQGGTESQSFPLPQGGLCTVVPSTSSQTEKSLDKICRKKDDVSKREIDLSEEKVETIKEVMKSITLPSTAIPNWASEIDEDTWRKKLNDSIGNRSSVKASKERNVDDMKSSHQ